MNEPQKPRWVRILLIGGIISGLVTGCAWSIGSSREGPPVKEPTKGQELIDLKKARDSGAITPEEYEAQKQKVLDK